MPIVTRYWMWIALVLTAAVTPALAFAESEKLLGVGLPPLIEGELIDLGPDEGEEEGDPLIDINLGNEGEPLIDIDLGDGEGEGEGDVPLIDIEIGGEGEIIDIDLGEEGEGGLLDDLLDLDLFDIVVNLPLPIFGPDEFEPDNAPSLAIWTGLQEVTSLLLEGLLPTKDTHNFHVQDDEDWNRFYANQGEIVNVETRDVYPGADTFITVYRLASATEALPETTPAGCNVAWMDGPDGERLFLIGCNDDTNEEGPQGIRSKVAFVAPETGIYYSRVTLSPKAKSAKGDDLGGAETTYNYQATSKGFFSATMYCTVMREGSSDVVSNGTVSLDPYGMNAKYSSGVYTINGVPEGTYMLSVTAPGYHSIQEQLIVTSGSSQSVVHLQPVVVEEGEEEGSGSNTEGAIDGEQSPEGEPSTEGEVSEGELTEGEGTEEQVSEGEEPTEAFAAFDYAAPHGVLSLPEVLRIVQLFNARRYHCSTSSEDGFAPYTGGLSCAPHPLDASTQDWSISLSELLRAVQFFNVGGYHTCPGGEGEVCAGPAS